MAGNVASNHMQRGLKWSLVGHAGAIALIFWLWHPSAAPPEPPPAPIDIVTVQLPPPPEPPAVAFGPRTGTHAGPEGPARMGARDSRETVRRNATHPPDPYGGDVKISYDDGPPTPSNGTAETGNGAGSGLFGDAYGQLGSGNGGGGIRGLKVPRVLLSRAASPRRDYSASELEFPGNYIGQSMILDLDLDKAGHVTKITIIKGLHAPDDALGKPNTDIERDNHEDVEKTITGEIKDYEFWPALDDLGNPQSSKYRWIWVLRRHDW